MFISRQAYFFFGFHRHSTFEYLLFDESDPRTFLDIVISARVTLLKEFLTYLNALDSDLQFALKLEGNSK